MTAPVYPIPSLNKIEDLLMELDIRQTEAIRSTIDYVSRFIDHSTTYDPLVPWAKENFGEEYEYVVDTAFRLLLSHLHRNWANTRHPLNALEELVIDFRAALSVNKGQPCLLERVAGISEYDSEDVGEQHYRQSQFHSIISRLILRSPHLAPPQS